MAEEKMAWARQPDDRQWNGPEGDDPRTLYQMLMTSVERFGNEPCFGYIPEPGMARVHLDYNEFGELATSVAKRLNDLEWGRNHLITVPADLSHLRTVESFSRAV